MIKVSAVVLAGGSNSPAMAAATGVKNRALVELSPGKTMLDYVINAALSSRSLAEIIIVGNVPAYPGCKSIPSSPTFLQNLVAGVKAASPGDDKVLIITSDIPFITANAIDDFVQTALYSKGDFCYPIIPMDVYRKTFATMKRTTLKLTEGEFTGGNIMLISRSYVRNHQRTIDEAYSARKNVFRLGGMLGWGLLGRIIVSQAGYREALTVKALEAGVSKLLGHGANAKAVVTQFASLGTDIDKPADIDAARRFLGKLG